MLHLILTPTQYTEVHHYNFMLTLFGEGPCLYYNKQISTILQILGLFFLGLGAMKILPLSDNGLGNFERVIMAKRVLSKRFNNRIKRKQ